MSSASSTTLSVLIPILNESSNLRKCLSSLPEDVSDFEVILCDGGSTDDTLEVAREFPYTVVSSPPGRALQMNTAARCARGDTLLFLHADTQLPSDGCKSIIEAMSHGYSMGCFKRCFESPSKLLAFTSRLATWRARRLFLAYGDQAIFIKRNLFEKLEGYREIKRFEDLDLAVRARPHGRWIVLPVPIITNARRFGRHPLPRILKDFGLTLAWLTGMIRQ